LVARVSAMAALVPEDEGFQNRVKGILQNDGTLLAMEFVQGTNLIPDVEPDQAPEVGQSRLDQKNTASTLGRILAMDIVLNNWDRIPLPLDAWVMQVSEDGSVVESSDAGKSCGNMDNFMFCEDGMFPDPLIAIDTDMKLGGAYQNRCKDEASFLAQLATLIQDLHTSTGAGELCTVMYTVREFFMQKGVSVHDDMLAVMQAQCSATLHDLGCASQELQAMLMAALRRCEAARNPGLEAAAETDAECLGRHEKAQLYWNQMRAILALA